MVNSEILGACMSAFSGVVKLRKKGTTCRSRTKKKI
jgi:hypothetical protein